MIHPLPIKRTNKDKSQSCTLGYIGFVFAGALEQYEAAVHFRR